MILIFGFSLIYWTGILTGLFFIFSFLGCCCHSFKFREIKIIRKAGQYHKKFIYLAFVFFILHASLALLAKIGIVI